MAVNVDTVYQTVQALANKEQRGYLTPQEFNLFANQAQKDIFEQYFYDLNAFKMRAPEEHSLGDPIGMIKTKIAQFMTTTSVTGGTNLPTTKYHGKIYLSAGGSRRALKKVDPDVVTSINNSLFHKRGFHDAIYFDDGPQKIQVWDGGTQVFANLTCEVVDSSPSLVYWGYVVINEKAVHDPDRSRNFDLHYSEQADLVAKILKLAGISLEDQELYQAAAAEEALNIQQENK